jgi:hypothetical protein
MTRARDVAKQGGLTAVIPTSIVKGASGTASVAANGVINFAGTESISMDGCFTSTFDNYRMTLTTSGDVGGIFMKFRQGTTTISADYSYAAPHWLSFSGFDGVDRGNDVGQMFLGSTFTTSGSSVDIYNPAISGRQTNIFSVNAPAYAQNACWMRISGGIFDNTASMSGFQLFASGGNITGTVRIYGYNNGA